MEETKEGINREKAGIFPTKILLATDGSKEAGLAALRAVDLAVSTGSELHLVTVSGGRTNHLQAQEVIEQLRQSVEQVIEEQVRIIEEAGGTVDGTYVRVVRERRDRAILGLAAELEAGLVVVGSRGLSGAMRTLMGSVSDSIVRQANCPVMVVRRVRDGEAAPPAKSILLLATDGSGEAEMALEMAVELASSTGSELHIATVGREYQVTSDVSQDYETIERAVGTLEREAQGILYEQKKKAEEAGGNVAKTHRVMGGQPDEEIVRLAEGLNANLIVVGSRGLGGIRRSLMGSVSDSVVRNAPCPVLVVRGEGVRSYPGTEAAVEASADGRRLAEAQEGPSFWKSLLGPYRSGRQEKVLDYVVHRIGDGANLREVMQEEYVRRNASRDEVEEILDNPRLVEAARKALGEDFSSGKLDPG